MNNKVLVEIIIPTIEKKYDVYLPVNKKIGNVINLLCKAIKEIDGDGFDYTNQTSLYNNFNGQKYNPNDIIRKTDIRNGSKLIIMW